MRAINVLLAILVSLLIVLGVFEGGLRLLGFPPPQKLNHFDPTLGWSLQPDKTTVRKTAEYTAEFEVNGLGLRDDADLTAAKPADTFRVVCLGDSFTLGFAVQREDLFVDQLERLWNAEGRKVDVVNTGTEAYSTDQEAMWLLENGDAFAPDLVLLFSYDNDFYWNGQSSYFGPMQKPRFDASGKLDTKSPLTLTKSDGLYEKSAIVNFVRTKVPALYSMFVAPTTDHRFTPAVGSRPILMEHASVFSPPADFMKDAYARTGGALKALKNKCDALGAKLVVAPIPSHSAIEPAFAKTFGPAALGVANTSDWDPNLPVSTMLQLCEANGIQTLDARAALKAATLKGEGSMYFQTDWHLNPAGNLAFAEFLDASLKGMNVFPAAHGATAESSVTQSRIPVAASTQAGMPTWMRVFLGLWVVLTTIYFGTYTDEPKWQPPLKVGGMLALIFTIVLGGEQVLAMVPPAIAQKVVLAFVLWLFCFILYKLRLKIPTIFELLKAFTMRGHWYLMPLVVVLLSIGSLLVVAASSPLVAPFIYTLF